MNSIITYIKNLFTNLTTTNIIILCCIGAAIITLIILGIIFWKWIIAVAVIGFVGLVIYLIVKYENGRSSTPPTATN